MIPDAKHFYENWPRVNGAVKTRAPEIGKAFGPFFQGLMKDGALIINEVAPRPHNSGHYTLDACTVSQFEQQVRAVCGLPLGEVRLLSPAAMINLIGDEVETVRAGPEFSRLLAVPGAVMHLYGKRTVRARRKMGHLTFVAPSRETAVAYADTVRARLARAAAVSLNQA